MQTIRLENKRIQFVLYSIISIYILIHVYIVFSPRSSMMNWYRIDDAFYYFQVARHIVAGQGISFDGINLSNGFHPLWMLFNLPIFALSGDLDFFPLRFIILLSAGITLGSGLLLYRMIKEQLSALSGLITLTVWLFSWSFHNVITQSGMEAAINAFFIILLLFLTYKLDLNRPWQVLLLGFAGAFTLLSRLDNIFFVLLIGVWIIFRQRPMRYLVLLDIFSVFISVFTGLILRLGTAESLHYLSPTTILLVLSLVFRLPVFYAFGLYRSPHDFSFPQLLSRFTAAILAAFIPVFGILFIGMARGWFETLPRSVFIYELILFVLLNGGIRILFRLFEHNPEPAPRIDFKIRWRQWFSSAALYLAPIGVVFGAYLLWNLSNFGTPMPVSGQVKQWWGTLPNTVYGKHQINLLTIFGLNPEFTQIDPWWSVKELFIYPILNIFGNLSMQLKMLICAVLLALYTWLVLLFVQTQKNMVKHSLIIFSLPPLLTAGLIQPFYLSVTGYLHARSWYWIIQMIFITLCLSILIEIVIRWLKNKQAWLKWVSGLSYLSIVLIIGFNGFQFYKTFPPQANPENLLQYTGMSAFLEENTEPGTIIGMTGGGLEAYFTDQRTIVNMDGLINSYEYFQMMQTGEAELFLDDLGMDYVFGSPIMLLESDPYWWFFTGRIEPIKAYPDGKVLYRYLITGEDVNP